MNTTRVSWLVAGFLVRVFAALLVARVVSDITGSRLAGFGVGLIAMLAIGIFGPRELTYTFPWEGEE